MIELGKYASTVLSAFGVSLALMFALVGLTIRRNTAVRKRLAELEDEQRG